MRPCGTEQEGIAPGARRHFLDFVGGDGVQQARAVAAAYRDAAARGQIDPCGAMAQRLVTQAHTFSLVDALQVGRNQDDDQAGNRGAEQLARAARVPAAR